MPDPCSPTASKNNRYPHLPLQGGCGTGAIRCRLNETRLHGLRKKNPGDWSGQVHPTASSGLLRATVFNPNRLPTRTRVLPPDLFWKTPTHFPKTTRTNTPKNPMLRGQVHPTASSGLLRATVFNPNRLPTSTRVLRPDPFWKHPTYLPKTTRSPEYPRPGSPHSKQRTPSRNSFQPESPPHPHESTAPRPVLETPNVPSQNDTRFPEYPTARFTPQQAADTPATRKSTRIDSRPARKYCPAPFWETHRPPLGASTVVVPKSFPNESAL